jgi:hypothetical protein
MVAKIAAAHQLPLLKKVRPLGADRIKCMLMSLGALGMGRRITREKAVVERVQCEKAVAGSLMNYKINWLKK